MGNPWLYGIESTSSQIAWRPGSVGPATPHATMANPSKRFDLLTPRFGVLCAFVLLAALSRLLPHPPNVAPIAAMALFGGAHFERKAWAFAVPLAALFLSDALLGFHSLMPLIYGAFAAIVGIGFLLRRRRRPLQIAGATLAGSVLFFVVTNLGVWMLGSLYPKTLAGLATCYIAAIPFFGNTLLGDAFFTAVLFGGFGLAQRRLPSLRRVAYRRTL